MFDLKFFPVFVNHVSESVQPRDLRQLFSRRGGRVLDVVIVSSHGFINMAEESEAHDVIHGLNGVLVDYNELHVDYSEELKLYLQSHGVPFSSTPDPRTGRTTSRHPLYPSDHQIESPFYSEPSQPAHWQQFSPPPAHPTRLEERLRKVNQELSALRRSGISSRETSRLSSRERLRIYSPERDGDSCERFQDNNPLRSDEDYQHRNRYHDSSPVGRYQERRSSPRESYRDRSRSPVERYLERRSSPRERYGERIRSPVERHYDRSRSPRERYQDRSRSPGPVSSDVREYELFVGGLHQPVSPHHLASLFSSYGKVRKTQLVKNFGFVGLLTTEALAVAACQQVSGSSCRQNRVSVSFRRGSRFEHLNEKLEKKTDKSSQSNDDDIVILEFRGAEEATELPVPVPVASVAPDMETLSDGSLRSDILQSWQAQPSLSPVNQKQYFDGYNLSSGAVLPSLGQCEENQGTGGARSDQTLVSDEVPGPRLKQPSYEDLRLIMATVEKVAKSSKSPDIPPAPPEEGSDEGPNAQRKLHISNLNSRINDFDLKDVFKWYGDVSRVDRKMSYAFLVMTSSERSIVKCVCEIDGRILKGAKGRFQK